MLALHNINRFHWHLSEDQGWRIEIKSRPELTEIGSKRAETVIGHNSGKYEVTLSARQLARDVFIEIPVQGAKFTDNFFDLLPGQTKKVIITSDKLKKNEKVDIPIKQLSDTN